MKVAVLNKSAPASAERDALRAAIEKRRERDALFQKLNNERDKNKAKSLDSYLEVERAEAALAEARKHETADRVSRLLGEETRAKYTVREAVTILEAAQRASAEDEALAAALKTRVEDELYSLQLDNSTNVAVGLCIQNAPEVIGAAETFTKARAAYVQAWAAMSAIVPRLPSRVAELAHQGNLEGHDEIISRLDKRLMAAIEIIKKVGVTRGDAEWTLAIERLHRDADAPLPGAAS